VEGPPLVSRSVLRASLLLGLVMASVVYAAPPAWTLPPLPADWKDVTAEWMKEPAMQAQKETIIKAGGTFDATIYAGDAGGAIMVITSVFSGGSGRIEELNAFMEGSRNRAAHDGQQLSWNIERTETMLAGTQRITTHDIPATTKTYIGYRDNDDLRAIAFMCYGADEICGPLIAKVTVDSAGMQKLSELDLNKKKLTPRRIAWIVGAVATLIFVLAALWKRRPRAPQ
jgi:hypothetical protein